MGKRPANNCLLLVQEETKHQAEHDTPLRAKLVCTCAPMRAPCVPVCPTCHTCTRTSPHAPTRPQFYAAACPCASQHPCTPIPLAQPGIHLGLTRPRTPSGTPTSPPCDIHQHPCAPHLHRSLGSGQNITHQIEITKVKIHWKMPLTIHWKMPLKIHDDF